MLGMDRREQSGGDSGAAVFYNNTAYGLHEGWWTDGGVIRDTKGYGAFMLNAIGVYIATSSASCSYTLAAWQDFTFASPAGGVDPSSPATSPRCQGPQPNEWASYGHEGCARQRTSVDCVRMP